VSESLSIVVATISALLAVLAGVTSLSVFRYAEKRKLTPRVTRVSVSIPDIDHKLALTYPLKCYVTMRNDAMECADVRLSAYRPRSLTVKDFPLDVLQLRFGRQWCPTPDGVDHLAVLPGQLFRAWIGLDERNVNEEQARGFLLRGDVGTLVFLINGNPTNIELEV